MIAIVRLFESPKRNYYKIKNNEIYKIADKVVVESPRGIELGEIISIKEDEYLKNISTLTFIIRGANDTDIKNYNFNKTLEPEVINTTKKLIKENKLDMKLLCCYYSLDRKKLSIYYESDDRVDFRNLLKDLAKEFKTGIELRQTGTRDSTKLVGGLGSCGYITCCSTYLSEFEPITIKDVKNQNLVINTLKLSGLCQKLMCCIKYEEDNYLELKKHAPNVGSMVNSPRGKGKIIDINLLVSKVLIRFEDAVTLWFNYDEKGTIEF